MMGHMIAWLVEALCYEGSSPDGVIFLNLPNPSSCIMAPELTQPLTEMSTGKCFWGVKRSRNVRLTTSPPSMSRLSRYVGFSTSHNPIGLHDLLRG
jgi:hypothetical protein